ncbi:rhodanese-like domain-containing protein [Corynebacterium breve]|uniref:Rhodanese-like domain-containing protein n=1 Tax=Corynebacterium breve TaxID=3049799 RepID=A0ABY8VHW3_9CORY|nr:rhodanese-like domain-containing protein [Corynebacterium breve]WIM68335.1 rhodanese-like domain-containing protein [Corynebacterium breve]
MFRSLSVALAAGLTVVGLAACSSEPTALVTIDDDTIIIDARSPAEADSVGYLENSRLLDFNSGEVEAEISQLDPDAEYMVYCRSGNRSAQTVALLEENGFDNVTDLGSMEEASQATGLSIIR